VSLYSYEGVYGPGLSGDPFSDVNLVSSQTTSPAAGADFSVKVPDTGGIWEVVAIRAQLVTSSAVANRGITVNVKDHTNSNIVYQSSFTTAVTASLTIGFCFSTQFATTLGDISTTKVVGIPLAPGPYLPGWTINSSTALIDTGDQWSAIWAWYRLLQSAPNAS
jgi:hypothetical protein